MADGPAEVAERIVHALGAPGGPLAGLPAVIAARVLTALGLSEQEHQALSTSLGEFFHAEFTRAVEMVVRHALDQLGQPSL